MLIVGEDNNQSDNLGSHKDDEPSLKESNIEKDNMDLIYKSLDIESHARHILSEHTTYDRLLRSKLSLFLTKVKFH